MSMEMGGPADCLGAWLGGLGGNQGIAEMGF